MIPHASCPLLAAEDAFKQYTVGQAEDPREIPDICGEKGRKCEAPSQLSRISGACPFFTVSAGITILTNSQPLTNPHRYRVLRKYLNPDRC
jgi:hypothetical protein